MKTSGDTRSAGAGVWASAVLAAAALVSLGAPLAFVGPEKLARAFHDDAFYYFQIARNVASGDGFTFDGLHGTNGFHPLWLFFLVPVFSLFHGDDPPLRAILLLQGGLGALAAITVYRHLRTRVDPAVALATAAAIFGLPWARGFLAAGMESALLLVLLAAVWGCFTRTLEIERSDPRRWLGLGILCAAAFATRLEAGVLVLAVLFCARARLRRDVRSSVAFLMPPAIVVVAYLAWNRLAFGIWVPVSGLVKAELAGRLPLARRLQGFCDLPWVGRNLVQRLAGTAWPAVTLEIALLVALGIAAYVGRERLRSFVERSGSSWIFVACLLWLLLDRTAIATSESWNCVPWVLATAVLIGAVVADRPRAAKVLAAVLVCGAFAGGAKGFLRLDEPSSSYATYRRRAAIWIRDHLDGTDRVGSWNAGLLGYFSHRSVVNLDGLVNDRTYLEDVIRGRALEPYLDRERIGWLADQACGTAPRPTVYLERTGSGRLEERIDTVASFVEETAFDRCPGYAVWRLRPR